MVTSGTSPHARRSNQSDRLGFVLGFVVGPLLWAPMSEVFGRRKLFIFTYILFTIFNGGVIASQNIWTLIILRFLAGTAGSSPLTNVSCPLCLYGSLR